jgi:hypothetical protein
MTEKIGIWPERKTTRIFAWMALFALGIFVIIIPLGYYLIAHQNLASTLEAEAEVNADQVSQVISVNPAYWQFLEHRLSQYITNRPEQGQKESRRLLNSSNEIVAESLSELKRPLITKSRSLKDSGVVVGKIEITASLMPMLIKTALLFLFVLPFGLVAFAAICYVPLRQIDRAEKAEQESKEKLQRAYEELRVEIEERKLAEAEREKLIVELREALSEVKQLSSLLPICASCKKIRDDKGYWNQLEQYLHEHSGIVFTHGICPECAKKLYPNINFDGE